jgi:hypothetical protein
MRAWVVLVALSFTSVACSAAGEAPVDAELRALEGPFVGMLMIEPNPPRVGEHRVVITLDVHASTLEHAQVVVAPWMPAHGHGTAEVEAVEMAPGLYVADDVFFNMPGVWDLHVHVADERDTAGELIATVDVP